MFKQMQSWQMQSWLERPIRIATGLAFVVLMAAVIIQVLGRSVFSSSPVWTEELTRFALLYLAALGAGPSYRNGELVNVDLLCEALPGRGPRLARLLAAVATLVLCAMLILPAWTYTSIGALQTSPALGWRMDFIHASVLVLLLTLFLFAALRVLAMLTGASDGLARRQEDQPPKTDELP
ncbi:TRAP transporter small permease [Pelagibius sp. Alg239-R121]|uniref:TRAP transporter small permease n=1 Tax=Pelagibius sp. Alg239-R121 TaxID=2993448 RepID=UPI0024A725F2|nr:TRAP transporter small permease subunit [Pelagibius sp. Alg239-R121]